MINTTQFSAAGKVSVDTLFGLANQAFSGVEQLAALNLQTIKTLLAESAESSQAALSVKSPADLMALQTAALQAAPQKMMAYGRQMQAILMASSGGQFAAAESQATEMQAKFLDAVNGLLKNVPGSENTVALMKSAVASANTAYEGVQKASKQVSAAVDANITKFTETAAATVQSAVAKTGT